MVQLLHLYRTTGKTIALTVWTFVSKVMSLLFNMLCRFVIALLRSKHLLMSWLQSLSAVIFWAQESKVCHCFHCFPFYLPWSDGTRCHDLHFFECRVLCQLFQSPLSLHQEALEFLFVFCHKGGIICISQVIDSSPGNLDSSLCFIQLSILPDVLCTEVK